MLVASLALFGACLLPTPASAQFIDPGLSFGLAGGGILGNSDDVLNRPVGAHGRFFLRFGVVRRLQIEAGVTTMRLPGKDLSTQDGYGTFITPLDFRLVVSPLLVDRVNPFAYVGGGALAWTSLVSPVNPTPGSQKSGWTPYIPGGLGVQIRLSDYLAFEVSGGYNYTFTDDLELLRSGSRKDAYWSLLGGLTLIGESENADPDNDGLSTKVEKQLGTNPRKADTDGDKLADGAEVMKHKTDPLNPDTDGDGLTDRDEIITHTTDPLKADTDGDGLSDGEEIIKYFTNPLQPDTDGDGLSDWEEVAKYTTNPVQPDTDQDGLKDGDEVNRYRTNPLHPDTDSGTVTDSVEIARGTDPLNPNDDVPKLEAKVGKKIVLEGITFETGKAQLTPGSVATLELAFNTLRENEEIVVEISGHTDNTGGRATNKRLSIARANAVKEYLVTRGVDPSRVKTSGYGPDRPIASNSTKEGRAKNRRIEFTRIR